MIETIIVGHISDLVKDLVDPIARCVHRIISSMVSYLLKYSIVELWRQWLAVGAI